MVALLAGGVEFLGGLFGAGEAAAGGAALGAEAIGAGAGEAAGALGSGLGAGLTGAVEGAASGIGGASAGGFGLADLAAGGLGAIDAGGGADAFAALSGGGGPGPATALPTATGGDAFSVANTGAGGFGGAPETNALLNPSTYGNITGASTGQPSTFGSLLDSTTAAAKANPFQAAGAVLGAGALGYNLSQGGPSGEQRSVKASADQLGQQGRLLASYLQSGTLPPGLTAQVQKATDAARARVIQNHAHNGMPTDPSQNSALAQELNNIDQMALMETAKIGEQLLTTGINEVGMADDLYLKLIGINQQQSANTGRAIANFAAALGGSKIGQQGAKA